MSSAQPTAIRQALAALQTQAEVARDLLTLILDRRDGKPYSRSVHRQLRSRLREAHITMRLHRAECDAVIRIAYCYGITIPDMTPELVELAGG